MGSDVGVQERMVILFFFLGSILLLLFLLGMIAAMTTRSDGEASLEWGISMKSATGLDWFYQ